VAEKQISVKLTDDIIQTLDKYAERIGKSRHDLIKTILEMGVDEIDNLKKVGIFQVGMKLRDLHNGIQGKLRIKTTASNDGEGKPIPVKLSEEFIEKLDRLAEPADITRHKLMQNFIKVELQELVFLDKSGILTLAISIRDLGKGIKKIYAIGRKAFNATDKE